MASDRKPRLALEPEDYQTLKVWSALEGESPATLVGRLIKKAAPPEVRSLLKPSEGIAPKPPEGKTLKPSRDKAPKPKSPNGRRGKRKPLADDPEAQEAIKALLAENPDMSIRAIAQKTRVGKDAVGRYIKKLREARAEETQNL